MTFNPYWCWSCITKIKEYTATYYLFAAIYHVFKNVLPVCQLWQQRELHNCCVRLSCAAGVFVICIATGDFELSCSLLSETWHLLVCTGVFDFDEKFLNDHEISYIKHFNIVSFRSAWWWRVLIGWWWSHTGRRGPTRRCCCPDDMSSGSRTWQRRRGRVSVFAKILAAWVTWSAIRQLRQV